MDTVTWLNHYRTSVVCDRLGLEILAILYRDGPLKEANLPRYIVKSQPLVRDKIRQLFQAGLISFDPSEQLYTTGFAEGILSRIGVSSIAAKSVVSSFDHAPWERDFIHASIDVVDATDAFASHKVWIQLKTHGLARDYLSTWNKYSSRVALDTNCILVLGVSPLSQPSSRFNLCDRVFEWHYTNSTDMVSRLRSIPLLECDKLRHKCTRVLKMARASDAILSGEIAPSRQATPVASVQATFVRILSALLSGIPDSGLRWSLAANPQRVDSVLANLEAYQAGFVSTLAGLLAGADLASSSNQKEGRSDSEFLAARLKRLVGSVAEGTLVEHESLSIPGDRDSAVTDDWQTGEAGALATVIDRAQEIAALCLAIEAGEYDDLPLDRRIDLLGQAEQLAKQCRLRWMGSMTRN